MSSPAAASPSQASGSAPRSTQSQGAVGHRERGDPTASGSLGFATVLDALSQEQPRPAGPPVTGDTAPPKLAHIVRPGAALAGSGPKHATAQGLLQGAAPTGDPAQKEPCQERGAPDAAPQDHLPDDPWPGQNGLPYAAAIATGYQPISSPATDREPTAEAWQRLRPAAPHVAPDPAVAAQQSEASDLVPPGRQDATVAANAQGTGPAASVPLATLGLETHRAPVAAPAGQIAEAVTAVLGSDRADPQGTPLTQVLKVQLHPDHLGPVEVRLRLSGSVLEVKLGVSAPSALAALRAEAGHLSDALDRAGYRLESLAIDPSQVPPAPGAGDTRRAERVWQENSHQEVSHEIARPGTAVTDTVTDTASSASRADGQTQAEPGGDGQQRQSMPGEGHPGASLGRSSSGRNGAGDGSRSGRSGRDDGRQSSARSDDGLRLGRYL